MDVNGFFVGNIYQKTYNFFPHQLQGFSKNVLLGYGKWMEMGMCWGHSDGHWSDSNPFPINLSGKT